MESDIRDVILQAATKQFQQKGLKFTMQDIADDLHIAKKTMYKLFPSKEVLLRDMIDNGFEKIHQEKARIMASDLEISEKIRQVITAFPDQYKVIDFSKLDELAVRYPDVAHTLTEHLETNWEPTLQLIQQGIEEGKIKPVNINVLRMVITASFERFLSTNGLEQAGIHYQDGLKAMMDIIMDGIREEDHEANQ
jgi:AcrR family transcriptional regulator